ncbi:hypothetical protein KDH_43230 [Dictyobacter sp. S3.2.2.5]|uniref:Uncharacterized protein n=1 Tax=Dictyobacter halimunensis TaxID=3026934 RepID=A0ABQ6FT83_9CHLR|nr:hypothetical protein KDH_43230 [Dictyobacter sp. S3.2.2.5]
MAGVLNIFIGVIVVLFIAAIILIGISMYRSRNAGNKVTSRVDPIPDAQARNEKTRVDQNVTTRADVNRNYNKATDNDELNRQR